VEKNSGVFGVRVRVHAQTGSGKTFTIYGTDEEPGLTPRGVAELFRVLDRDSGKYTFSVKAYMLELYQDELQDLLLPPCAGQSKALVRLGRGKLAARRSVVEKPWQETAEGL
jgi:Kinesin motor domain